VAVILIGTRREYIGLSTDPKPTTATPGSTFYETDTLNTYEFDNTAWQLKVKLVQVSGSIVSGLQVRADQAVAFANSAVVNTLVNVDFVKPSIVRQRYKIAIYNPSTVTDLTIKLFSVALNFGGGTQYDLIDTIVIPKSQAITGSTVSAYAKFVEGLFVGVDLRLVVSNNTVLGVADGFTGYVRIREC
jgi:hypothetical protein